MMSELDASSVDIVPMMETCAIDKRTQVVTEYTKSRDRAAKVLWQENLPSEEELENMGKIFDTVWAMMRKRKDKARRDMDRSFSIHDFLSKKSLDVRVNEDVFFLAVIQRRNLERRRVLYTLITEHGGADACMQDPVKVLDSIHEFIHDLTFYDALSVLLRFGQELEETGDLVLAWKRIRGLPNDHIEALSSVLARVKNLGLTMYEEGLSEDRIMELWDLREAWKAIMNPKGEECGPVSCMEEREMEVEEDPEPLPQWYVIAKNLANEIASTLTIPTSHAIWDHVKSEAKAARNAYVDAKKQERGPDEMIMVPHEFLVPAAEWIEILSRSAAAPFFSSAKSFDGEELGRNHRICEKNGVQMFKISHDSFATSLRGACRFFLPPEERLDLCSYLNIYFFFCSSGSSDVSVFYGDMLLAKVDKDVRSCPPETILKGFQSIEQRMRSKRRFEELSTQIEAFLKTQDRPCEYSVYSLVQKFAAPGDENMFETCVRKVKAKFMPKKEGASFDMCSGI